MKRKITITCNNIQLSSVGEEVKATIEIPNLVQFLEEIDIDDIVKVYPYFLELKKVRKPV